PAGRGDHPENTSMVVLGSRDVKRVIAALSVVLLLAIAGYSIYVAVVAAATRGGKHYSPRMCWTAIALFWLIAAASLRGAPDLPQAFRQTLLSQAIPRASPAPV